MATTIAFSSGAAPLFPDPAAGLAISPAARHRYCLEGSVAESGKAGFLGRFQGIAGLSLGRHQ
jgi:hypothetical protein